MLNKNDPLIAAVQKVMQTNQAERDAVSLVNEKFGVSDRRALPNERQHEWDAAYKSVLKESAEGSIPRTPKERELAKAHGNTRKITHGDVLKKRGVFEGKMTKSDIASLKAPHGEVDANDLAALRAGEHKKKPVAEEKKMKGDDPCWDNYQMVGMKKKGGKEVPNCVPVKEQANPEKDPYREQQAGSVETMPIPKPKPKPVIGDSDREALTNKIKSVVKEATEKQKRKKIGDVFGEFKRGTLHSGRGGPVVTSKKQATAIALSTARRMEESYRLKQIDEKASPAVIAADKKRNPRKGETLGNIVRPLIPGVDAAIKAKEGDYAGAAKSAAYDVGTTLATGIVGRTALKYGSKAYNYLRGSSKATSAAADSTKLLAKPSAPASSSATKPAASSASPSTSVASTPKPAGKSPTPVSGSAANRGTFMSKLSQARRNAGSDPKARQLPALRKTTQPTVASRPNLPATTARPSTAVTRPGMPNLAAGGRSRIVGLSPLGRGVVAAGAGAAALGIAASQYNKPPSTVAGSEKKTTPAKVDSGALNAAKAPTSYKAEKGDVSRSTVWGMAKRDIQNKRGEAAASVPDAGQGEISMARASSVSNKDVANRTNQMLKSNQMTQSSARKMQPGKVIKAN